MPNYEYDCSDCGSFMLLRPMEERGAPAACPACRKEATRRLSVPRFALMASGRRAAFETNERSRHAPKVRTAHQCASGCGCSAGRKVRPSPTIERAIESSRAKRYQTGTKGSRPWMLGH